VLVVTPASRCVQADDLPELGGGSVGIGHRDDQMVQADEHQGTLASAANL
jgi:hypothetical protein